MPVKRKQTGSRRRSTTLHGATRDSTGLSWGCDLLEREAWAAWSSPYTPGGC